MNSEEKTKNDESWWASVLAEENPEPVRLLRNPDASSWERARSLYEDDAAHFRERLAAVNLQDALVDLGWVNEAALPHILALPEALLNVHRLKKSKMDSKKWSQFGHNRVYVLVPQREYGVRFSPPPHFKA